MPIYAEPQNKLWLARELQLWPQRNGIDLSDSDLGVELKSRLRKYRPNFTIHNYQIDRFREENVEKELFWAFLSYDIAIRPQGWRIRDREAWLVPWEFAQTLPVSVTPNEEYRYVHGTAFPYDFRTIERPGGIIHFPIGSALEERAAPKRHRLRTASP